MDTSGPIWPRARLPRCARVYLSYFLPSSQHAGPVSWYGEQPWACWGQLASRLLLLLRT